LSVDGGLGFDVEEEGESEVRSKRAGGGDDLTGECDD
jgi:hypothetical protein